MFASVKLVARFETAPERHFIFNAVAPLRDPKDVAYTTGKGLHEDVLYFWDRAAREFVEVLRSYGFEDYKSLQFQLFQNGKCIVDGVAPDIHVIATNCEKQKPLNDAEIDQFCSALNSPTTAELEDTLRDIHGARKPMGYRGAD